uniref:Domain of unknown function at the cortex 1 domain-containing protein n=1 Tax=Neospora caninum (strain Liverpool) TaxID=572307 RepID=A0A0F7UFG2_NEOCL|nr:TPA: hypothetical protein BN1204_044020 [Neospora caninum Liverpool]
MEQAYNTFTSYLRNAPLTTSISDPLAACSTDPVSTLPSSGTDREGRPTFDRTGGWATSNDFHEEASSASSTMGGFHRQSERGEKASDAFTRKGSSISDALWSFHENLKRQWSQLQLLDQPAGKQGRSLPGGQNQTAGMSGNNADAKSLPALTSPGSSEACPRGTSASPHNGLPSPVRQGGFLSSTSCTRSSTSPAAGDTDYPLQEDDFGSGPPASSNRDSVSRHAPRRSAGARCLAAAAPNEDRVLGAASDGKDLGVRDLHGRARMERDFQSSKRAKPSVVDGGHGTTGATRSLAEAYLHLRVQNRTMWMSLRTIRVVLGLQLGLSVLGFLNSGQLPGFSAEDPAFRSAVFWLYVAAYIYSGWCLYTLRVQPTESWDEQQARETAERLRQQDSSSWTQLRAGQERAEGAGKGVRLEETPVRDHASGESAGRRADLNESQRQLTSARSSSHSLLDRERIPPTADADLPPVETWPQRPVFLRATEEAWVVDKVTALAARHKAARTKGSSRSSTRGKMPIVRYPRAPMMYMTKQLDDPTRAIHWFENPFFRGVAVIRLAPVGGSPGGEVYTDSKKRYLQACFQGQFLQPHRIGEVLTGQVFSRRLRSLPPRWMVNMGMKVVKQLTDTLKEDISSNEPYFLTPAVCVAQTIHVAHAAKRPRRLSSAVVGEEQDRKEGSGERPVDNLPSASSDDMDDENFYIPPPDVTNPMIQEDTRLLGGPFSCGGISAEKRKRLMGDRKILKELVFSPDYIYTFDFFQNIFYPSSYEFDLGVMRLDLAPYLNRQPIELMALLDDSFIRDETSSAGTRGTSDTPSPSSLPSSDRGAVSSSIRDGKSTSTDGGDGTTGDNPDGEQSLEDEDVSKWQPPTGSWKFLWRYQMWHEKLLSY